MPAPIDLAGQRFGRLAVIGPAGHRGRVRLWLCRCDCGRTSTPSTASLRSGNARSCGTCTRTEAMRRGTRPETTRPDAAWEPWELVLLGEVPDAEVARHTGRSRPAVQQMRRFLGLRYVARMRRRYEWTPELDAMLGTMPDRDVAERWKLQSSAVTRRRLSLRIPAHQGRGDRSCGWCGERFHAAHGSEVYCAAECCRAAQRCRYQVRKTVIQAAELAAELAQRIRHD